MADKTSRKNLKEPDDFISFTQQGMQWVQENRNLLIGATAIVLVAVVAMFGFRWYTLSAEKGSDAFVQAREILDAKVVAGDDAGTSRTDGSYATEEDKLKAAVAARECFQN